MMYLCEMWNDYWSSSDFHFSLGSCIVDKIQYYSHLNLKSQTGKMFGQIVIGPPGAGKTTYCRAMQEFLTGIVVIFLFDCYHIFPVVQ